MDIEHDADFHWWQCDHIVDGEPCPNNGILEKEAHYVDPNYSSDPTRALYNCQKGYVCGGCGYYFGETSNHSWVLSKYKEPKSLQPDTATSPLGAMTKPTTGISVTPATTQKILPLIPGM